MAGLIAAGSVAEVAHFPVALPGELSITPLRAAIAGMLVGFGTRMGNGCTSGHGVSGLSRFSPRSLVAVVTFMACGSLSSYASRVYELDSLLLGRSLPSIMINNSYASLMVAFFSMSLYFANSSWKNLINGKSSPGLTLLDHLASFSSGIVFGSGLVLSGMCDPSRVTGFLDFLRPAGFDPSLAGVMGGAVLLNMLTYKLLHANKTRVLLSKEEDNKTLDTIIKLGKHPDNMVIDARLVLGSAVFGLGWGIGGI